VRRLTLTAFEAEVGQQVVRIGEKEFATPSTITRVSWSRDDMVLTLDMDGGEVSMYLGAGTEMDVVHPVQQLPEDNFDLTDDLTAGDGYYEFMRKQVDG
jgi:hypothetical protein